MDLSPPAILQLRAESYFALTSNSVQLGSRVEMGADLGVAAISGHFSFDALVVFSPQFMFMIDLGIGLTVRALGVDAVRGQHPAAPRGPGAVAGRGHAEVEILWWTVDDRRRPVHLGRRRQPAAGAGRSARSWSHAALHHNPGAWQALDAARRRPGGAAEAGRRRATPT